MIDGSQAANFFRIIDFLRCYGCQCRRFVLNANFVKISIQPLNRHRIRPFRPYLAARHIADTTIQQHDRRRKVDNAGVALVYYRFAALFGQLALLARLQFAALQPLRRTTDVLLAKLGEIAVWENRRSVRVRQRRGNVKLRRNFFDQRLQDLFFFRRNQMTDLEIFFLDMGNQFQFRMEHGKSLPHCVAFFPRLRTSLSVRVTPANFLSKQCPQAFSLHHSMLLHFFTRPLTVIFASCYIVVNSNCQSAKNGTSTHVCFGFSEPVSGAIRR